MAEQKARAAERRRRAAERGVKLAVGYRERETFREVEETARSESEAASRTAETARTEADRIVRDSAKDLIVQARATVSERRDEPPPSEEEIVLYELSIDGVPVGKFRSAEEVAKTVSALAGPGQTIEIRRGGRLVSRRKLKGTVPPGKEEGFPWALVVVPAIVAVASAAS